MKRGIKALFMKSVMNRKSIIGIGLMLVVITATGCGLNSDHQAVPSQEEVPVQDVYNEVGSDVVDEQLAEEKEIEEIEETTLTANADTISDDAADYEENAAGTLGDEQQGEILSKIEEYKASKDINGAILYVYELTQEYPDNEFLIDVMKKLQKCQKIAVENDSSYVSILEKKGCKVALDYVTDPSGNNIMRHFDINLGGGYIEIGLDGKFKTAELITFLSNISPTKASVDIDIYADDKLVDSIRGFNINNGSVQTLIDVTGVDILKIESADHTHEWIGEASFSRPDSECHFSLNMYTEEGLEWNDVE